jgi:hypothetical protein
MTKRELVQAALNELGIAEYEFDVSPEELSSGSARLDSMMSTWSKMNLRIPYNYTGNYDSESGIPVTAVEAVTTNLAKRLAPSYGKQTPPEVLTTAKSSLNALLSESAEPLTMQLGSLPYGAGHKRVDTAIFTPVEDSYPWKVDEFKDYSGSSTSIQLGDTGTEISISLSGTVDTSTIISSTIRYRKPSGTTGEWTGTVVDELVQYVTQSGDIDEAGVWYIQAFFDTGTWQDGR